MKPITAKNNPTNFVTSSEMPLDSASKDITNIPKRRKKKPKKYSIIFYFTDFIVLEITEGQRLEAAYFRPIAEIVYRLLP